MTSATGGEGGRTTGGWEARLERSTTQVRLARTVLAAIDRVSPDAAARLAMRLFRTVRPHRVPARELAWTAAGESFRHDGDRFSLEGIRWGEGPAVLLQHGWEGRASQMGGVGTTLAAAGREAVALTAPGHGAGPRVSSLWQFALALSDLVRREGPFSGFVGHSFGVAAACFALQTGAITIEQLGSRLVFISPAGDLNDFFEVLFSLLELRPEVAQRFVRRMEDGLGVAWSEASLCTSLAASDVPLLIVHDEGDRDTPIAGAEMVAAAWPRSRLHRTSGLGHRRILRDEAVLALVSEFLAADRTGPTKRPLDVAASD